MNRVGGVITGIHAAIQRVIPVPLFDMFNAFSVVIDFKFWYTWTLHLMKYSTFLISNLPSFSTHTQSPVAHVQQHPSYHFYSLLVNIFLLHRHVFMASIRFTMLNTELFSPSHCFCISKGFQHWIRIQHLWLHTSASSMFVFAALKLCQISLTVKPQKGESKWKHMETSKTLLVESQRCDGLRFLRDKCGSLSMWLPPLQAQNSENKLLKWD